VAAWEANQFEGKGVLGAIEAGSAAGDGGRRIRGPSAARERGGAFVWDVGNAPRRHWPPRRGPDYTTTPRRARTELSGNLDSFFSNLGGQAAHPLRPRPAREAIALLKEQERICRQLGNLDGLSASLGNQANILSARGQLDEAIALLKEQERICRQLGNLDGLR